MKQGSKLVVAAATFNRPKGLARLLAGLQGLTFGQDEPQIEVVIVDNSVDANARAAVEATAATYRWPLHYAHQDQRGIAHTRNRALEAGLERGADWFAFIDDDEYPDPLWLDRMIAMARQTGADVVVGAVKADFDAPPSDWMVTGGFFEIDRYAEGTVLDFGNTSNVLFDMRFVREHGLRFDLAFGLTGGEDTYFFEHVQAAGGRIVFCKSGIVYEQIVPHRATLPWLIQRWRRSGNTDGRIVMRFKPGLRARVVEVFGGGLVRLCVGGGLALLKSPLALMGKGHVPAEHLRVASRGLGFMMSAFGRDIEEYRSLNR